jgi:hypothetical protein
MQVKIQVDEAHAIVSVHRKDGSLVGQIEEVKPHKPTVVTVTPDEYVMVMADEDD